MNKLIQYLNNKVGSVYSDALNDFTYEEKKKFLGNPKISPKFPELGGIDYQHSKIDELFLKEVDKFIKGFYFTTKKERSLNAGLSYDNQQLYLLIWEEHDRLKRSRGKSPKYREAVNNALLDYDENLTEAMKDKYYRRFSDFRRDHNHKSLKDFERYLISIDSKLI